MADSFSYVSHLCMTQKQRWAFNESHLRKKMTLIFYQNKIGIAMPKPAERMPHMSTGPNPSSGDDTNNVQIVLGRIKDCISERYKDMKENGDWSVKNAWANIQVGTGKVYDGYSSLRETIANSKDMLPNYTPALSI